VSNLEYADTPAGPLAYLRSGQGEPLLLIMGVAGHHRVWSDRFIERLAERFDVVAYDHRGIGRSARADTAFTIPDLAEDAAAVLDHLSWDSAHVMGHSLGGTIAQELALAHPDRIRTLTLASTWGGPGETWGPGVLALAQAGTGGDPETIVRGTFAANVSARFAAGAGTFEAFAKTIATYRIPGPVVLLQMEAAAAHDALARLGELDHKTLVIHGTADEIIVRSAGERLSVQIPGAELELFDGLGHLFFWEQPDRSAELIIKHALG
jgi:pimeloyl-ACP methyl ester carboxylesterase